MGAAASTLTLSNLSAEEVGKLVAGLGGKYTSYESLIVDNGLSGEILASLNDDQIKGMLTDCGITNAVHQTVLLTHFNKLKGGASGGAVSNKAAAPSSSDCCQFHALPTNFEVGSQVTKVPRSVMCDLFQIQGISVDPTDLDPAVDKIVKAVGGGFGDGKTKYDCFINYRVASDSDLAEKLYLYLATKGIYAFLDKKCLKNGEKWKEGFLTGLKNSKCFVALISRKALDKVRDKTADHTYDNVLLEYETALNIMTVTNNPKYICPLHVGECSGGNLAKFQDFSPALYPDSLTAIVDQAPPANTNKAANTKPTPMKANPPPAPAADDNGNGEVEEQGVEEQKGAEEEVPPEDDGMLCGKCGLALSLHEAGTWGEGWGCDWPGHEGDNHFPSSEPVYGCPTIGTCNWGVCQTCWNDFHNSQQIHGQPEEEAMITVDQPEGTKSFYNDSYYCEVEKLVFRASEGDGYVTLIVYYNVRGDMSLGPLQDPISSCVYAGNTEFTAQDKKVYVRDAYQNQGELHYHISIDDVPSFTKDRVVFRFGSSGYSDAVLTIPNSEYRECELPVCSSGTHTMLLSDYHEGGYQAGYVCDICRAGKSGFRWFCLECHSDKCFSCEPLRALFPQCTNGHDMERCSGNKFGSRRCDLCKRTRLQFDPEFYHCTEDGYDLCLACASQQQAEKQSA